MTIDIPDEQLQALHRLSAGRQVARAEIVQTALDAYLRQQSALNAACGAWAGQLGGGLESERRQRRVVAVPMTVGVSPVPLAPHFRPL